MGLTTIQTVQILMIPSKNPRLEVLTTLDINSSIQSLRKRLLNSKHNSMISMSSLRNRGSKSTKMLSMMRLTNSTMKASIGMSHLQPNAWSSTTSTRSSTRRNSSRNINTRPTLVYNTQASNRVISLNQLTAKDSTISSLKRSLSSSSTKS